MGRHCLGGCHVLGTERQGRANELDCQHPYRGDAEDCGEEHRPQGKPVRSRRIHVKTKCSRITHRSRQCLNLKHKESAAFDDQASQPAGRIGAGIDVDAVWPDVGLADRRVPVDDDLPEVVLAKEKVVADPKQVFIALLLKGNARFHSGMDEEEIPAGE
jgi:hypothetical protein